MDTLNTFHHELAWSLLERWPQLGAETAPAVFQSSMLVGTGTARGSDNPRCPGPLGLLVVVPVPVPVPLSDPPAPRPALAAAAPTLAGAAIGLRSSPPQQLMPGGLRTRTLTSPSETCCWDDSRPGAPPGKAMSWHGDMPSFGERTRSGREFAVQQLRRAEAGEMPSNKVDPTKWIVCQNPPLAITKPALGAALRSHSPNLSEEGDGMSVMPVNRHAVNQRRYDVSSVPYDHYIPSANYVGRLPGWTQLPNPTKSLTLTSARNRNSEPKVWCGLCRKNGELPRIYKSHRLHSRQQDGTVVVTCPVLRRLRCDLCGASGDTAHTRTRCPKATQAHQPLAVILKQTRRRCDGSLRSMDHYLQ